MTAALRETPLSASLVDGYSARHLTVLEGLEAVRKRPGMYIGSTDERGMLHCLWEIIDNAVDEALNATCTKIEIILHADHSAEVRDNGRGIPVDIEPKSGLNGVELIMTRLHAGGKFGGSSYTASGGLHGVGASVVNALSGRLDVLVEREGYEWLGSFRRGVPGVFAGDGPEAKLHPRLRAAQARQGRSEVAHRHADQVLARSARSSFRAPRWSSAPLIERARQTAYLVPGLSISITDERVTEDDGPAQGRRVQLRRRHRRVLRAPEHRRAGHRRAQADRRRQVHRDRARAR